MKWVLLIVGMLWMGPVVHGAEQPVLKLYIAAKETAPGLHPADFAKLKKVGYIGDKPDLTISQLESVKYGFKPGPPVPQGTSEMVEDHASLELLLTEKDVEAVKKLTSDHIGARLLLMLNDEPLAAPEIKSAMTQQTMYLTGLPRDIDTKAVKAKLETLVQKNKDSKPSASPAPKV